MFRPEIDQPFPIGHWFIERLCHLIYCELTEHKSYPPHTIFKEVCTPANLSDLIGSVQSDLHPWSGNLTALGSNHTLQCPTGYHLPNVTEISCMDGDPTPQWTGEFSPCERK